MDCREVRELLEEFRRGELEPVRAQAVEAHLRGCPACRALREADDRLARAVQELGRTPAPAALRRRIRALSPPDAPGRGLARRLRWPVAAALAAAAVVTAILLPWGFWRARPPDPVERLVASGVAEHRRIVLQLGPAGGPATGVPDPAAAFAAVRAVSDVQLAPVFAGDARLRLVDARPTLLADRKAAAATLAYESGAVTTCFALPGRDLPMPATGRVQIEQYRPWMRQVDAFQVIYWKQADLAYVMVTGLDDPRARQLYLKMRKAL
jgi:anti-sigma factor RsiW